MKKRKKQYYDMDEDFSIFSKKFTKILILSLVSYGLILISCSLLVNGIFKEPTFDKYTSIIVTHFLWWDVAMLMTFLPLTVVFAWVTIRSVKEKDNPKWAHLIWIALTVICVFQMKKVTDVILDMKYESYVSYQGEFTQNNDGYGLDVKTTRLMPEDVRLKSRSDLIESGDYVGTVIYTERSGIALEVKDAVLN